MPFAYGGTPQRGPSSVVYNYHYHAAPPAQPAQLPQPAQLLQPATSAGEGSSSVVSSGRQPSAQSEEQRIARANARLFREREEAERGYESNIIMLDTLAAARKKKALEDEVAQLQQDRKNLKSLNHASELKNKDDEIARLKRRIAGMEQDGVPQQQLLAYSSGMSMQPAIAYQPWQQVGYQHQQQQQQ